MQAQDLEQFKDFILSKNNYFNVGFANAYKDVITKAILVRHGNDLKSLLPHDTLGNYCYLRHEMSISYDAVEDQRITDGGTQRLSFNDTMLVHFVAIVHKADAFLLTENLRNTCMMYEAMNVQPLSSNWNREHVLAEELQKMKAEDIAAALQRLKDETIVKLTLAVSKITIPGNCIIDPVIY